MPFDRTRPLLNALADGELPPWTAARVRRHLKTCETCRAEHDALVALGARARAWRDIGHAPAALETRLTDAYARMTQTKEENPMPAAAESPIHVAPPPRPGRALRPALVGAGALAALLAAAALFLPGSPGRPTVAFADVQRAMAGLADVSWTQTQQRYDLQGHLTLQNTQQFWVRRDRPAIAEQDSASTISQIPGGEYAGPTWMVSDAHGLINAHPRQGMYYLHPAEPIARRVQSTLDGLTASPGSGDSWKAEQATLLGRPALVFRQHIHGLTDGDGPERHTVDGDETFWADPHTLRVLRHRSDLVWGSFRVVTDGGQTVTLPAEHIVIDAAGFQYDTPAPVGVFDLAPPSDAHVTEDDGQGNQTVVSTPPHTP